MTKFFDFLFQYRYTKKWQVIFWLNGFLLLYLTLTPSVKSHISIANVDKFFHFVGFGAFAFFCSLAFRKLHPIWVIFLSFLLGASVEILQSYIPSRSFSYADMVADFLGVIAAVLFLGLGKKMALQEPVGPPQS